VAGKHYHNFERCVNFSTVYEAALQAASPKVYESAGAGQSSLDPTNRSVLLLYDDKKVFIGHSIYISGCLVFMTHFRYPTFYRVPLHPEFYTIPTVMVMEDGELSVIRMPLVGVTSMRLSNVSSTPKSGSKCYLRHYIGGQDTQLRTDSCDVGIKLPDETTFVYSVDTQPGCCGAAVVQDNKVVGLHCYGFGNGKNGFVSFGPKILKFFRGPLENRG